MHTPLKSTYILVSTFLILFSYSHSLQAALSPTLKNHFSVTSWPDCFFHIWPFKTMKFCPKAYKKSHQGYTTLPNIKFTFKMLSKISKFLLNWRNFAKSTHTAHLTFGLSLSFLFLLLSLSLSINNFVGNNNNLLSSLFECFFSDLAFRFCQQQGFLLLFFFFS